MKCKHCDGTGRKIEESDNGIGWIPIECEYCNGTGEVEQTNEEWFCGLSTEEKVKALLNLHEKVRQRMRTDIGGENSFYKGNYYREWLKKPHREE